MTSKSDFWLRLHDLSVSLRSEGEDGDNAMRNIAFDFHSFPATTQDNLLDDIDLLVEKLLEVRRFLGRQQ